MVSTDPQNPENCISIQIYLRNFVFSSSLTVSELPYGWKITLWKKFYVAMETSCMKFISSLNKWCYAKSWKIMFFILKKKMVSLSKLIAQSFRKPDIMTHNKIFHQNKLVYCKARVGWIVGMCLEFLQTEFDKLNAHIYKDTQVFYRIIQMAKINTRLLINCSSWM